MRCRWSSSLEDRLVIPNATCGSVKPLRIVRLNICCLLYQKKRWRHRSHAFSVSARIRVSVSNKPHKVICDRETMPNIFSRENDETCFCRFFFTTTLNSCTSIRYERLNESLGLFWCPFQPQIPALMSTILLTPSQPNPSPYINSKGSTFNSTTFYIVSTDLLLSAP